MPRPTASANGGIDDEPQDGAARFDVEVIDGTLPVHVSGEGPSTILFVHGWTLDHSVWTPQYQGLSEIARVVGFDRRGFGKATAPPGLSKERGDLLTIVNHLGGAPVWLIGQSQGARVATAFALAHPALVAGLILQGAPAMADVASAEEIPRGRFRALMVEGKIAQVRQEWMDHPLMRSHHADVARMISTIVARYEGRDLRTPDDPIELGEGALHGLSCPVLVMIGEHESPLRKRAAKELAGMIPHADLAMISGAGHLCNVENATAFNECVRSFVDRRRAPRLSR